MNKKFLVALLLCLTAVFGLFLVSCDSNKTPETVKITLNKGDGSEATVSEVKAEEAFKLPTPTRDGYSFEGWYLSSNFSGSAITEIAAKEDTQVYAKWEKLYTLTLDAAGGALSTATLQLKAGANILSAVSALTPTKTDCAFGEWLLDGETVTESAVMPSDNITLTATYKVKYTVELYLQNEAMNGYVKSETPAIRYAYVGETVTAKETVTGYTETKAEGAVTTLVLSDKVDENVFKCYFNRASYTLTFVSNFPDGSQNQTKTDSLIYGIEKTLPFVTFEMNGYYLEGWALTADGAMKYSSHIMDDSLYNATAPAVETVSATGDLTLYAVWSKGYSDLFGGSDTIYVSKGEEKTVYLNRGGIFFKGKLKDTTGIRFYDENDDILYSGQLNPDGATFLYQDTGRSERLATLFIVGKGLDENIKIYFDEFNGLTYTVKGEDGTTTESKGVYIFDENGYYYVTYTEGSLKGTSMTLVVGQITVDSKPVAAFQVRDDEEFKMGKIVCFILDGETIVVSTDKAGNTYADLTLNGFGIATLNQGTSTQTYYYTYDKEKQNITLTSTSGTVAGVIRLLTINGELGYMLYDESTDVSYTLADGSVLSIDGMLTATYKNGNKTVQGFYTTKASKFGGTILSFVCDGVTYNFMITTKQQEGVIDPANPDAAVDPITVTIVETLGPVYAEYTYDIYAANGKLYTNLAPLFVFDGKDMTTVTIYGYTENKTYYKIATGKLVYNAANQTYALTVTDRFNTAEPTVTTPFDFATIKTATLMLYDKYGVHFWLEYETTDGTVTNTSTVYTDKNSGATLTLTPVITIYNKDGSIELATYSVSDGTVTLTFADRTAYVKLDESTKTFIDVTLPTIVTEVGKDGSIIKTQYLTFPSQTASHIIYTVITVDGETQIVKNYTGTRTNTGKTSLTGFTIYLFESDEKKEGTSEPLYSFRYIAISTGYFFTYDEAYAGTFNSENGVLKLDGFGFAATYGDSKGLDIIGMYLKDGDNVSISASSVTYNFRISGTTCALRGDEYNKTYLVVDNQIAQNLFAKLDGLGHATVFRIEIVGEESKQVIIDENATYTLNGTDITLIYSEGIDKHTLVCKTGTYQVSSTSAYNALNVTHDEVVSSYVNGEDWSILALNNDGTAVKYLKDGSVETGTYSIITDSLLYYVNSAATSAFIYVYDHENGTAVPQSYEACAYYTEALDSLLFSQYGFAIFNNTTRYYYTIEDDQVTIYHHDVSDANRNQYDYVKESFGTFDDVKDYNNKTYYKNDGYAISFERKNETSLKYPLGTDESENPISVEKLMFTPGGGEEFSVSGSVIFNGKSYSVTVIRTLDEEGNASMYFVLGTLYFDISINYQGEEGSTYEVSGLAARQTLPAYNYLYYYYYIYTMLGAEYASQVKNSFGTIQTNMIYDEEGKLTESYLNGVFGASSKFLDANGNLIDKVEKADMVALGSSAYIASFTANDGFEYTLLVTVNTSTASIFGTNSYAVYGLVRNETLTTSDGYTVEIGRITASDTASYVGSVSSIGLKKGEEELKYSAVLLFGNTCYYVVNETDENGKITKTTYYKIDLVETTSGEVGGDDTETDKPLPTYESAAVTVIDAKTYMTADGKSFVDILSDNSVMMMNLDGKTVVITASTYDETTKTYTLTAADGTVYAVTVNEAGVATIDLAPGSNTTAA